jgi:preprotein translocase subunit SecA
VIYLRAYAQKNPINEYKQEAFSLFERMLSNIRDDVTQTIARVQFQFEQAPEGPELPTLPDFITNYDAGQGGGMDENGFLTTRIPGISAGAAAVSADPYAGLGLSRNAECPCGSGKRYKHCHGALA